MLPDNKGVPGSDDQSPDDKADRYNKQSIPVKPYRVLIRLPGI